MKKTKDKTLKIALVTGFVLKQAILPWHLHALRLPHGKSVERSAQNRVYSADKTCLETSRLAARSLSLGVVRGANGNIAFKPTLEDGC